MKKINLSQRSKKILEYIHYISLIISILPLFFHSLEYPNYAYVILFLIFICDIMYSYKQKMYDNKIILAIDIVGTLSLLSPFQVFVFLRFARLLQVIRRLPSAKFLFVVVMKNWSILKVILQISLFYMIFVSVIMYNVEPQTFPDGYFQAFYWAGITLTTVGYGDIIPQTEMGQVISLISSFLGIGIISLPTGLITSAFVNHLKDIRSSMEESYDIDKQDIDDSV